MSKQWYLCDNDGKVVGPYGIEVLQNLIAEGRLFATAKVCEIGSQDWINAGTVQELFPDLNQGNLEFAAVNDHKSSAGISGTQQSGMNDATTNPVGLANQPTDLQLEFAKELGVENAASMSKGELTRTFTKMLACVDDYDEIMDAVQAIAGDLLEDRYALTLYQKGQKYIVDVLHYYPLDLDEKNRFYFECEVPKIDRSYGPDEHIPEWGDKTIDLSIDKIIFYRELPESIVDSTMDHYRQTIAWGVEKVREMGIEADVNPIAKPPKPRKQRQVSQPRVSQRQVSPEKASGCGCLVLLTLILSLAFAASIA